MRQVLSAAGVALLLITLTSCGSGGGSHSVSIAITTAPGSIPGGTQYIFEATTTNSQSQTSGVSWVLAFNVASNGNTTTPCDASCGTLSNTGTTVTSTTTSGSTTYYNLLTTATYTAPLEPPNPNNLILTATAVSNSSLTEDITFTIGAPGIVVKIPNKITTIAPASAPVTLNATVQFDTANAGVTWTLNAGGASCSPACGTLSNAAALSVTYTPPATVPASPNNTPTITATSVTDTTKSDFDTFTIGGGTQLPISVQITNPFSTINAGSAGVAVNATVTNDLQNEGVTWTLSPTSGTGALSAATALSVLYTPPNQAAQPPDNTPTLTATSVADPTKSANFTFTIEPASATAAACTLSGPYVFALSGKDSAGMPLAALGRIVVDAGKITAGSLDINDNSQSSRTPAVTGTCTAESVQGFAGVDSRGAIVLDTAPAGFAQPPHFEYVIFRGSSSGTLRETTAGKAHGYGSIYAQSFASEGGTSAPSAGVVAPPSGTFALDVSNVGAPYTPRSMSGRFEIAFRNGAGTITGGTASDISGGGYFSGGSESDKWGAAIAEADIAAAPKLTFTGIATPPDATGRGTLTFDFAANADDAPIGSGATESLIYTIVTPKLILLLQSSGTPSTIHLGAATQLQ
jgi:hypothetical protein